VHFFQSKHFSFSGDLHFTGIVLYIQEMKLQRIVLTILHTVLFLGAAEGLIAQPPPDARNAFLRSLVVPGWGHYYADSNNWNRGKFHLGAEAVMIGSLFGLRSRISNLEKQYITLASLRAGVDISDRSRRFQLAVGEYNNLHEYNDFQLRSRNWNRLFDNIRENRWEWAGEDDREQYNRLRADRDRSKNQIPALLSMMAVNRIISAISAYNRAEDASGPPEVTLSPGIHHQGVSGVMATMQVRF
jgi:hypothetical protein